jgi:hypothetical protein
MEKAWRSNMADCEGIVQRYYGSIPGAISFMKSLPDELSNVVFVDGELKANDLLLRNYRSVRRLAAAEMNSVTPY